MCQSFVTIICLFYKKYKHFQWLHKQVLFPLKCDRLIIVCTLYHMAQISLHSMIAHIVPTCWMIYTMIKLSAHQSTGFTITSKVHCEEFSPMDMPEQRPSIATLLCFDMLYFSVNVCVIQYLHTQAECMHS